MKRITRKKGKVQRYVVMIIGILFLLLLLPLYCVGNYARPCADDYYYGADTAKVWEETHSITETIEQSAQNTKKAYQKWQGNFSGIFLMGLEPGVFGAQKYAFTTIIILTTFVASNLFFYYQLMLQFLKKNKSLIFILSMVLTMTALQFCYKPVDSFYWYNGGIYYTFFYSLSLLLFGLIMLKRHWKGIKSWIITVIAVVFAFVTGGSNYSTSLISLLVLALINLSAFVSYRYRKKGRPAYGKIFENALIFSALAAAFLISVLAPGNAVRQASVGGSSSVLNAILLSFCYAGYNIATASSLPVICIWCMVLPVLWKLIPDFEENESSACLECGEEIDISAKSRREMWIKLILLFCLFSAQGTPVFYAQGIRIPYRLMNIIYFSYFTFVLLVLIIVLKECKRSKKVKTILKKCWQMQNMSWKNRCIKCFYGIIFGLFCIAVIGNIEIKEKETERGKINIEGLPITAEAIRTLVTGEAQAYGEEADMRLVLYEDRNIRRLKLKPFQNRPYLLYHSDITEDKHHWKNRHVSKYYEKEYVVLQREN